MSSRRTRSRQDRSVGISDEQITDLVNKLQALLPDVGERRPVCKASASRVLGETCKYIRSLHREVEGLSERLAELLASSDSDQAAIIRSLLQQ